MAREHLLSGETAQDYAAAMQRAVEQLAGRVESVEQPFSGIGPRRSATKVAPIDLDTPLGEVDGVLDELAEVYLDDTLWFTDPHYLAHLNPPPAISALVADAVTAVTGTVMDSWDQSGSATMIERRLIDWLAGRIRYGTDADGVFTGDPATATLQALLLARGQACLEESDPMAPLSDTLGRLRILTTAETHIGVVRAANVLGMGAEQVIMVGTDSSHRMDPFALGDALDAVRLMDKIPMAVVASAGTADLGIVDPLDRLADVCEANSVWFHVDASVGGGLLVSRRRRHLLNGIARTDSVTLDFHSSWFQPVATSALIVRDGDAMRHATWHDPHVNPLASGMPHQADRALQTSRRFDALRLWTTLRTMGPDTIGDLYDDTIDLAHEAFWVLHDDPALAHDFEVAMHPTLGSVVFRFRPSGVGEDIAAGLNRRIHREVLNRGAAVVASTTFHHSTWLVLRVANPHATIDHVRAVATLVHTVGHELLDELRERAARA